MAATYSLGTYNDNFFKQAACLLAIAGGMSYLQGWAAALFTLPFVLFAGPAGFLADRFPKRHIVIASKAAELVAMLIGAAGILTLNWWLILAMVGIMGLQSTVFSPALNGSIPELYPAHYVLRANSVLKMATSISILLGIIVAGLALDHKNEAWPGMTVGRVIVACGAVGVSLVGLIASFGVPLRPAANPAAKFPWKGPADTVRVLLAIKSDRLLALVVLLDAYVWFVAALQALLINILGMEQFALGEANTAYLLVAELLGVAIGGLVCGRVASGRRWLSVLVPAGFTLAGAMLLIGLLPMVPESMRAGGVDLPARFAAALALLLLAGAGGGMLLVPLEAFIQARPPADRKGQVIAAANFAAFTGMMISGLTYVIMVATMPPTAGFAVMGVMTLIGAIWLGRALKRVEDA